MATRITLALLIDQLVSGYARLIIEGMERGCRAAGANLIVFTGRVLGSTRGHEYQYNVIYDYIRKGSVDALVMATGTQGTFLPLARIRDYARRFGDLPFVSVGAGLDGAPNIRAENRTGILEAVDHLVGHHGARRVAFLKGPESNIDAAARLAAFREAIRDRGLEDDPALLIPGDFTRAGARRAVTLFLDSHAAFDALLAANDEMAMACLEVLREHGVAVPGEAALIGFDNIADAQFLVPSLTTVEQHLLGQGEKAAAMAVGLARGEKEAAEVVLPTRLVLRTSCGCLPRAVLALDMVPPRDANGSEAGSSAGEIADRCLAGIAGDWPVDFNPRSTIIRLVAEVETTAFLRTFQAVLYDLVSRGLDIAPWQYLLALLQGELIRQAPSPDRALAIRASFEKALMLLGNVLRIEQGRKLAGLQDHFSQLRRVMERLISVSSLEELMNDVAGELSRLDIETCFIARYAEEVRHHRGEPWSIPARAEAMLVRVDGKVLRSAGDSAHFGPGESFLPPVFLDSDHPRTLVAIATFFREDQIGYIVFEPGTRDWAIYEAFCVQLGSLLKGSLLFAARQRMIDALLRLAALVESSRDAIFGVDLQDLVTSWNRGAEGVFGFTAGEMVGQPVSALFTPESLVQTRSRWKDIREGRPVCSFETACLRKNGSSIPTSLTLSPIVNEGGTVAGVAVIARDVTEEKALQSRFIQAQRLESLETLAAGVAHQFNNIAMIVTGNLDALMETGGVSPKGKLLAGEAMKGAARFVEIAERFQGLTGSVAASGESCNLPALVRSHVGLYEQKLEKMHARLFLDLRDVPPVRMDPYRVAFILSSLLDNALDALADRPERSVTVRTGLEAATAFLEVSDTGCGIRRDDLPRLFTPFYTTKGEWAEPGSSQAKVKGVGLSLSVCRSTVAASGGKILVESEHARGATFRVQLPVAE